MLRVTILQPSGKVSMPVAVGKNCAWQNCSLRHSVKCVKRQGGFERQRRYTICEASWILRMRLNVIRSLSITTTSRAYARSVTRVFTPLMGVAMEGKRENTNEVL
jgi:hypothetical protein